MICPLGGARALTFAVNGADAHRHVEKQFDLAICRHLLV
jgi:hypothetical protein